MASADVSVSHEKYFCHQCQAEVLPTEDITCSQCYSGAIEELTSQREASENDERVQQQIQEVYHDVNLDPHQARRRGRGGAGHFRYVPNRRPRHSQVMVSIGGGSSAPARQIHMGGNHAEFDSFIQQLLGNFGVQIIRNGVHGGDGGFIGGSLGDYAWGPNGLDNVITQLLNQLDNSGPPPADESKIESLPIYKIEQKDIEESAECAVCRDTFELEESVKKLPCDHKFHQPCIDPWLKLHDSCPICRCNLNGERSRDDS